MEGQYTRAYKRAPERIKSFLAAMDISGAQPDGELLHIIMTEDPDKSTMGGGDCDGKHKQRGAY